MDILDFFFNKFLNEPAILLAVIVSIGYAALGRNIGEIISGAIKTAVGFGILQVGAGALVSVFKPLIFAISETFGIQGIILDPYAGLNASSSALEQVNGLAWVGYSMMLGFAFNILFVVLRKWTGVKTVFVTGHVMYVQAAMATWSVYFLFNGSLSSVWIIVVSGLFLAVYWSFAAMITLKPTNEITENAGFAIGHQQMLGAWLAYKLAPLFKGKNSKSIDEVKMPGFLNLLQDNVISSSLIMLIAFGSFLSFMGPDKVMAIQGLPGKHWITRIIMTALAFPIGIVIIMQGVKMFVTEMIESFEGIRMKLLPDSAIAVDCAAVFGYASGQTVMYGFLFGAIGQIIAIIGLITFNSPIMAVPGFIPMFFDNATIGIFANKFGGVKATAIICTSAGLVSILGSTYTAYLVGLADGANTGFPGWGGSFDLSTWWLIGFGILKAISSLFGFN